MLTVELSDIDNQRHRKLIRYLLSQCDVISFHIPGFYDNGMPMDDMKEYHQQTRELLQTCLFHGGKQQISNRYYGMRFGWCSKIIMIKPFQFLQELLLEHRLFDWLMQNGLPEDVCFLEKGKLRYFTCAHDESFFVYNETQADRNFLSLNGFQYWQM